MSPAGPAPMMMASLRLKSFHLAPQQPSWLCPRPRGTCFAIWKHLLQSKIRTITSGVRPNGDLYPAPDYLRVSRQVVVKIPHLGNRQPIKPLEKSASETSTHSTTGRRGPTTAASAAEPAKRASGRKRKAQESASI